MHFTLRSGQRDAEQLVAIVLLATLVALLFYSTAVERLNFILYDTALKVRPLAPLENTAIVAIDERSLSELGQWPWPRHIHAQLLTLLHQYNSGPVAFDIIFAEPDASGTEHDLALALAMKQHAQVYLPVHIFPRHAGSTLTEVLPLPELMTSAAGLAHVHVELDQDGIARGLFLHQGIGSPHWPALALTLAEAYLPERLLPHPPSPAQADTPAYVMAQAGYLGIRFAGPSGSYPSYSYVDILKGRIAASQLQGKTLLVGATAAGFGDVLPTPVSGLAAPMPGVEFHANALSSLAQQAAIVPLATGWIYALSAAFVLMPLLLYPRLTPGSTLPVMLGGVMLITGFCLLLLWADNRWFPPAAALCGVLASYPVWSWQRLRQLDSYLSNELTRLQHEPVLQSSAHTNLPPCAESLTNRLQQLGDLVAADGYRVQKGQILLLQQGMTKAPLPPALPKGTWLHQDTASWLKTADYELGLQWQHPEPVRVYQRYLDQQVHLLAPSTAIAEPAVRRAKIATRIAQVQQALARVRAMRHFIFQTLSTMPDGIMVTDTLGQILFVNPRLCQWLSIEPQTVCGSPAARQLDRSLPAGAPWLRLVQAALIHHQEGHLSCALGELTLLIHLKPIHPPSEAETGMVVSFSDISPLKRQEAEREAFIGFLSHDIRAPLNAQSLLLEQLSANQMPLGAEILDKMRRHNAQSLRLAEQFVQLSRAQYLDGSRFYDLDLAMVIENAIDALASEATSKGMDIRFSSQVDSFWLTGDGEMLERVLINLLSNAIKFSPAQSVVQVACHQAGEGISITVQDAGPGVDPALQPRLFEPFSRAPSSRTPGSGLGLAFVKTTVHKHQGTITVRGADPCGSIFELWLPVSQNPGFPHRLQN